MKNKILYCMMFAVMLIQFSSFALAEEHDDIQIVGLELEKLLNLGSGLLAAGLFILTIVAYKRNRNQRLLYVSIAFALFAVKGFLTSAELLYGDWALVDPIASFLDFVILLSFFFGILKK